MSQKEKYRISLEMLGAGVKRLDQCRREPNHTPETVCAAIFASMLDAADIHPGTNLPKSFAWSATESRRLPSPHKPPRGRPKGQPWTRADFDAEGKRLIGIVNGKPVYSYMKNIWYLKNSS